MSDYVKTTNFAAKDSLPPGNAGKIVKGTEINTEFDNIATAVATKENAANKGAAGGYVGLDGSSNISAAGSITGTSFIPSGSTAPSSGVYLPAANTLGFATNSTRRWSIDSVGQLTNVGSALDEVIAINGTGSPYISLYKSGTLTGYLSVDGSNLNIVANTGKGLSFLAGAATRGSVNSSGNWNINAPSSGTALTVTGVTGTDAFTVTDGTLSLVHYHGGGQSYFGNRANITMNLMTNGVSRMSLSGTGNIAINAPSSTGSALSVAAGTSANWAAWTSGTAATSYMSFANAATRGYIGTDGGAIIGSGTGTNFGIRAENDLFLMAGAANRVTVNSSGNVTINAASSGTELTVTGEVVATSFAGDGSGLTSLSATQLTSGTVPDARFPATLPAASGVNLTALNATQLTSGIVPDARFPATLPAASGANLTALNATNISSGTLNNARLPADISVTTLTSSGAAATGNLTVTGTVNVSSTISRGGTLIDDSGSFIGALTGCTTSPTGVINWARSGKIVVLHFPGITGTSNTTSASITGLPPDLQPSSARSNILMRVQDNGTTQLGLITIGTTGTLGLAPTVDGTTNFTSSGTKGVQGCSVTYFL